MITNKKIVQSRRLVLGDHEQGDPEGGSKNIYDLENKRYKNFSVFSSPSRTVVFNIKYWFWKIMAVLIVIAIFWLSMKN